MSTGENPITPRELDRGLAEEQADLVQKTNLERRLGLLMYATGFFTAGMAVYDVISGTVSPITCLLVPSSLGAFITGRAFRNPLILEARRFEFNRIGVSREMLDINDRD